MAQRPRLDAYDRLIRRFYEPLILLRALGKTRGQHTTIAEASGDQQQARRQLLDNLAYLCDWDKGGPTTAAVALEEQNDCYVFWVASNGPHLRERVLPFFRSVVEDLQGLTQEPNEEQQERLVQQCIAFSEQRVKKEQHFLRLWIRKCENHLKQATSEIGEQHTSSGASRWCPYTRKLTAIDRRVSRWLKRFEGLGVVELCYLAYDQRKAPELKEITRRGRLSDGANNPINVAYSRLRHYLGRLSHHVRAPKQVVEDALRLPALFEPGASRVQAIILVDSVLRPEADGLTRPLSMLDRMTKSDNPLKNHYKEALEVMDQQLDLNGRIQAHHQKFRPVVHAEVQVLEAFYFGKRAFVQKDRYVGTSKPACYCCYLYFRSHPLKCTTSRAHQNIWLNWGPPVLAGGVADERYVHQRSILNSMLETIRADALDQISQKAAAPLTHFDSTTGITPSVISLQGMPQTIEDHWIEEQLGSLSIGESPQLCRGIGADRDAAGTEDIEGVDGDEADLSEGTPTVIDSDSSTSSPEDDLGSEDDDGEEGGVSL